MSADAVDRMVEQIKAFAELIEDPENWVISVPADEFDAVRERLETDESGLGTKYRGASLCYTHHDDEVWIRYETALADASEIDEQSDN